MSKQYLDKDGLQVAVDNVKEAKEIAAGAMALAQQAIDNAGPTNYSTSEQFTGKYWLDGKKIYRKTIVTTAPSTGNTFPGNSNSESIQLNVPVETFVNFCAFLHSQTAGTWISSYAVLSNAEYVTIWGRDNTHVSNPNTVAIAVGTGWVNQPMVVTAEYTKTTN